MNELRRTARAKKDCRRERGSRSRRRFRVLLERHPFLNTPASLLIGAVGGPHRRHAARFGDVTEDNTLDAAFDGIRDGVGAIHPRVFLQCSLASSEALCMSKPSSDLLELRQIYTVFARDVHEQCLEAG